MALIIVLAALLYLVWRALGGFKRRIEKETREATDIVHRAFGLLRNDLETEVTMLTKAKTKRKLTREESRLLKNLKANIDVAEQVIGKEIKDIEKEVTGQ